MRDQDNTQENVREEKSTQELVSDTVAATRDGNDRNDDSNAEARPPVSTAVIGIHSIEDFEVRQPPLVTQCFAIMYEVTDDAQADTNLTDADSAIEVMCNQ